MSKRIFVLDDEPDMVKIATDLLKSDGYTVTSCNYPDQALKKLKASPPDLLLLDVRLPDKDGFEICRELKADPKARNIPIIMVSVKNEETDVVVGLEMGADDYVTKPFRRRELLARVKAVLRRNDPRDKEPKLTCGPIVVDYGSYSASIKNKPIDLTPKEFELLGFFIKKEHRVVTRPTISETIWGIEFTGSSRTIDVHVDQLRKKLGRYGPWIIGLKGVGYRFEPDTDTERQ